VSSIFFLSLNDPAHVEAGEHIMATIKITGVLHNSGLKYKLQSQKLTAHMQLNIWQCYRT